MAAEPKLPPAIKRPVITLLTDYGSTDYRVGSMKGVIMEVNPNAVVVDITHDIPPHDLLAAALTLRMAYYDFPLHTIHVVAVDPGKGPKRRPILVKTENFIFLAPDNGVLSFIYQVEKLIAARPITASHYFRQPVNPNFHGRDIYASSAAYLSKSYMSDEFGEEATDFARINVPAPEVAGRQMKGIVLLADRFGNVITNVDTADVRAFMQQHGLKGFQVAIGGKVIGPPARTYGEGQTDLFAVAGASGFLEIASVQRSAAELLGGVKRGQECILQFE